MVGGGRAEECEGVPVTWEDVLREETHATGADAHGRWGEAIDVCAVQEGVLQFLYRDAVRGWMVELSEPADLTDKGLELTATSVRSAPACGTGHRPTWQRVSM